MFLFLLVQLSLPLDLTQIVITHIFIEVILLSPVLIFASLIDCESDSNFLVLCTSIELHVLVLDQPIALTIMLTYALSYFLLSTLPASISFMLGPSLTLPCIFNQCTAFLLSLISLFPLTIHIFFAKIACAIHFSFNSKI